MNFYLRYRYRNKVRAQLDFIWHPLKPNMSKAALVVAFGAFKWRDALNFMGTKAIEPQEAAVLTTCYAIEKLIGNMSDDRRAITLYALQTGNESNHEANNYLAIADQVAALGAPRFQFLSVLFTVTGALHGETGDRLEEYRRSSMANDAVKYPEKWA